MSDEIAEFLRIAAERREKLRQRAQQQANTPVQSQSPQSVTRAPLAAASDVVVAEVVDNDRPQLSKMSKQINQHLNTRGFSQRADQLGDKIEQADEKMESHLHSKFDHKMGNISKPIEAVETESTPQVAARVESTHPIMDLLRNGQSVRSAFIMSEIFRRPEENW